MYKIQTAYCAALLLTLGMTANAGIINGSFETPVQATGGYTYDPTGAGIGWNFQGFAGIAAINSVLFSSAAPDGNQAAFLQVDGTNGTPGSFSQNITGLNMGSEYVFTFFAADMPGMGADPFTVSLNGTSLGTFVNNNTSWQEFTSAAALATSPSATLTFASQTSSQNNISVIDDVMSVADPSTAPEPATVFLFGVALASLLFWKRRRTAAL